MPLEDHLGDIIRKGRLHANAAPDTLAAAAGVSTSALAQLEETGTPPQGIQLKALAAAAGLSPDKVEGIAKGWMPQRVDLGAWRELRLITSEGGGMSVNCYLIWDEVTRDAALFDTGFDFEAIARFVREDDLQLKHVFITHGHGDHVAALPRIRQAFPKARVHSGSASAPVAERNRLNECVQLGSLRISHRDTPGHAEDGVTYVVGNWPEDAPHVAIVGDAIFAGSMGGAAGRAELARQKVRDQILSLPPATLICPGHGPLTTVQNERAHNPFF